MPGIYKITSPSGKVYIGQTRRSFKERWSAYYKMRCSQQRKLYNSFLKYGVENHVFEIIEDFPPYYPLELLDILEKQIHYEYLDEGYEMLNLQEPGSGKHCDDTRKKIGQTLIGNRRSLGKKWSLSEDSKRKMSVAKKGKPHSDNHKKRLRESNRKSIKVDVYKCGAYVCRAISMNDADRIIGKPVGTVERWLSGRNNNPTDYSFVKIYQQ